jgi:hypothetical protein
MVRANGFTTLIRRAVVWPSVRTYVWLRGSNLRLPLLRERHVQTSWAESSSALFRPVALAGGCRSTITSTRLLIADILRQQLARSLLPKKRCQLVPLLISVASMAQLGENQRARLGGLSDRLALLVTTQRLTSHG